ncbi:MAG: hypothetical protein ABI995_16590 [Acidobacteriota bacterium]
MLPQDEARAKEQRAMVGKMRYVQACYQAEKPVHETDQPTATEGRPSTAGNTKLGDHPAGAGGGNVANAIDQALQIGRIEAIEKEVADDEIVAGPWQGVADSVGEVVMDPMVAGTVARQRQHFRASVHVVDLNIRVGLEQLSEESTIAVAQEQSFPRARQLI